MELQEIKEVMYLGFKFKRSGGQETEEHVKENRKICKGENKEGDGNNRSNMGNGKKEIWKKLEMEN